MRKTLTGLMRSQFSRTAAIFFNPETLLPFLLGSIFLAVFSNAIWQILFDFFVQHTDGNTTLAALQIGVGALIVFIASVLLFARGLRRMEPQVLDKAQIPAKHQGLILLVSNENACEVAITHHTPDLKTCWLLYSEKTRAIALSLEAKFATEKIDFKQIPIENIYDPKEFYKKIRRIYATLPQSLRPQEVIADYTGMTAHASVGMVLATLTASTAVPLQYTPVNPNRLNESLAPMEIVLGSSR